MFCNECGKLVAEGSKFCLNCGSPLSAAARQTVQVATPVQQPPPQAVQQAWLPPNEEENKKKAGGFWASGAGIALVVILGLAVIAGITFGIIFLVKGNSNGEVDAATMQVWDEYENVLADDSTSLAQVNIDPNALAKNREDLDKTQKRVETLEKVLQRTGGTATGKQNPRDTKAAEMAAALESYRKYIEKMNELYGVLMSGNLLDPNTVNLVNAILKDLQALADDVKTTAGDFMRNNTRVITKAFNPPVLTLPNTIATSVQKSIQVKQEAEKQRIAAEQAAAQQAAAAAEAELQRQRDAAAQAQTQMVTCPNCGGVGTVEGGDGRYTCGFCNGTGRVTQSKAATYNPADWRDY